MVELLSFSRIRLGGFANVHNVAGSVGCGKSWVSIWSAVCVHKLSWKSMSMTFGVVQSLIIVLRRSS